MNELFYFENIDHNDEQETGWYIREVATKEPLNVGPFESFKEALDSPLLSREDMLNIGFRIRETLPLGRQALPSDTVGGIEEIGLKMEEASR